MLSWNIKSVKLLTSSYQKYRFFLCAPQNCVHCMEKMQVEFDYTGGCFYCSIWIFSLEISWKHLWRNLFAYNCFYLSNRLCFATVCASFSLCYSSTFMFIVYFMFFRILRSFKMFCTEALCCVHWSFDCMWIKKKCVFKGNYSWYESHFASCTDFNWVSLMR